MSRRRCDQSGFTLIELLAVVAILAVLLAIAIPVFSGATGRAQDRQAQADARLGLKTERLAYVENGAYAAAAGAQADEPGLAFVTKNPRAGTDQVAVSAESDKIDGVSESDTAACGWDQSSSGTYFGFMDVGVAGKTYTSVGALYYSGTSAPKCTTYPKTINSSPGPGWGASTTTAGW